MTPQTAKLSRLLQFSDSAFPVGTFSFSNGLETAQFEKIVTDAETLRQYTHSACIQAAYSDGVAALHAFRAAMDNDYLKIIETDRFLMLFKMNDEARLMLQRMGKKLAELVQKLFPCDMASRWLEDINEKRTPGTYPIAQGIAFQVAGLSEEDLFTSHQYGVANMILGAALRCVRVSHYDTQQIIHELSEDIAPMYEEAKEMTLEDMNSFVPEMDIMASMHEKGNMRMFMS